MPRSSQLPPDPRVLLAVWLAMAFASGIILAMAVEGLSWGDKIVWFILGTATLLSILSATRRAGLLLFILGAGTADYQAQQSIDNPYLTGAHTFTAEIVKVTERSTTVASLRVHTIDGREVSPFRLTSYFKIPGIAEPGMDVVLNAEILPPFEASAIPGFRGEGQLPVCFVEEENILSIAPAAGLMAAVRRLHFDILNALYASRLSPESKTFIATALLGESSAMAPADREQYARAGLAHILALSGLHIAIIAGILFYLLAPTLLIFPRNVRSLLIIFIVWGYACLTGFGSPVVRASVMTTIVLLGDILQRRTFAINSLAVAALIILIVNPRQLVDTGFALSFVSVAAIVGFADDLNPFPKSKSRVLSTLGNNIGASLAAMAATGLITAYSFHSFPTLFLLANVLVLPILMPAILLLGIIFLIGTIAGADLILTATLLDFLTHILDALTAFISSIPWASIDVPRISPATIILLLATLIPIAIALHYPRHFRRMALAAIVLAIFTISSSLTLPYFSESKDENSSEPFYIATSDQSSDIIIPLRDTIFVVSSAPPTTRTYHLDFLSERLASFMIDRGIHHLVEAPDKIYRPGLVRNNNHMIISGKYLRVINTPNPALIPEAPHPDILVILPGYKGSIAEIINNIEPDSVVMSRLLNYRLRRRLDSELTDLRIPHSTQ